jgi:hypothetical protein
MARIAENCIRIGLSLRRRWLKSLKQRGQRQGRWLLALSFVIPWTAALLERSNR